MFLRTRKPLNAGLAATRKRDYSRALRALGPLAYWRLGEPAGDALDYSGNNRHGTLQGSGHTRAAAGLLPFDADKALTFSSTARVEVAYAAWQQSQAAFTIIAFVPSTAIAGAIVSRRVNGSTPSSAQFSCRGGDLVLSNGSAEASYLAINEPNSALPQMLVWSYDVQSKRVSHYSNGRRVFYIYTGLTVGNGSTTPLSIGGLQGGSEYYSNTIDDVAFIGRALTPAEVRRLTDMVGMAPVLPDRSLSTLYSAATLRIALRGLGGYSGALIDVRRSADDATRTINTTADGLLDTADLLSWSSGSAAVYVSKIYDQSGNGHHFTQGTNSLQPRIVNGGVVETKCGRPVLRFTNQNLDCVNAAGGMSDSDPCTVLTAYDRTSVVRGRDGSGSGWSIQVNPDTIAGCVRGGSYFPVQGIPNSAGFSVKGYTHGSSRHAPYQGAVMTARNDTTVSGFRSSTKGWNIGNSNGTFLNGNFGELVIWNSAVFTNEEVTRVVDDMMSYYGSRTLSEKILRDNPVRYFKMDEASGSTAVDATGNGNGTYVGSPTLAAAALTGMAGDKSVNFTASLQYIDTNLTTSYNTACTLECVFVGGTQISSGYAHLISKNQYFASGVVDFPIKLGITAGLIKFELSNGGDFSADTSLTLAYEAGVRYHVICTYRASGLCQLIVNGVVIAEATIAYTISTSTREWRIGAATELGPGSGAGMTTFIGRLGHAAIYDHALHYDQAIEHFLALDQP